MGIAEFFRFIFKSGTEVRTNSLNSEEGTESLALKANLAEYGIFTVIGYIATLIQQTQWHTYKSGRRHKGYEWYSWNIRPNPNQSAAEFWHELVVRLLLHGEALIFTDKNYRYIADSFCIEVGSGLQDLKYRDVSRDSYHKATYLFPPDVLYFKYNNSRARSAVMELCDMYGKMIYNASENYRKAGGSKAVINIDAHQTGTDADRAAEMKMLGQRYKSFLESKNAVLPLKRGYEYKELAGIKTEGKCVSDVISLRTEALKTACEAYLMPYGLVSGEVAGTSDAWELCTATVLNPFKRIFETEMNGKLYSMRDVINGSCIKGDITQIKPVNVFERADNIYKLIGCGYTHNEIRERTGDNTVDDPSADKRYFTKNNSEMAESGGETNGNVQQK